MRLFLLYFRSSSPVANPHPLPTTLVFLSKLYYSLHTVHDALCHVPTRSHPTPCGEPHSPRRPAQRGNKFLSSVYASPRLCSGWLTPCFPAWNVTGRFRAVRQVGALAHTTSPRTDLTSIFRLVSRSGNSVRLHCTVPTVCTSSDGCK